ncbi:hypothetical protein V8V91_08690 [Algoriphagus halophilus]|uniref:hypothetical protein n=1 Tax=Algoriphagus halophilus TaxID=226505 RepID=UPI00358EC532
MTQTKVNIEGTVQTVGPWIPTAKGDQIREIGVLAQTKRPQKFNLTQFCNKDSDPVEIEVGSRYLFTGFMNGIDYVNKVCITRIMAEKSC